MGTFSLIVATCFVCIVRVQSITANDGDFFRFASPTTKSPITVQSRQNEEIFRIPPVTRDDRFDQSVAELVSQSIMNFAHDLAIALDEGNYPNAQVFSPLSVMSALSLIQMGSNGNSYNQLTKLFSFLAADNAQNTWKVHEEFGWMLEDLLMNQFNLKRPRKESEWRKTPANPDAIGTGGLKTPNEHIIRLANGLFVQEGYSLNPDYVEAAQSVYKAEVKPLNFKTNAGYAKHYINSWVNQNTLGKIPAIITDELSSDTSLIIASALYFKGFWEQPFLASGTAEDDFFPDGPRSHPVRVQMMGTGGVYPYYNSPEYDCRIIGLPYKGNHSTMYIIQPHNSTRRSLSQLQRTLTGERINEIISKMQRKTAVLAFPKLHVTNTMHLKPPLQQLGINEIFHKALSDLSLITFHGKAVESLAPLSLLQGEFNGQKNIAQANGSGRPVHSLNSPSRPSEADDHISSQGLHLAGVYDRYDEAPLIFSRFGETNVTSLTEQHKNMQWTQQGDLITGKVTRPKRTVTYKVESEFMRSNLPLRLKDLILSKRITKSNPGKKISRSRRQIPVPQSALSLQNLDRNRFTPELLKPPLYVDEVLHKVDFVVTEQGTEAAAATVAYLRRSGTDVAFRCDTPFLILVRHDTTQLPLFYGKINIAQS